MSLVGLILLSLSLGLVAWLGFVWSVHSGQYDDPEGPKYRMLDDDDDDDDGEGAAGPGGAGRGQRPGPPPPGGPTPG